MKKQLIFLGIETSCDETAAAIVRENSNGSGEILSNVVSSQIDEHREFGGVVPEIAARAHVEKIEFIVQKAIKEIEYSSKFDEIILNDKLEESKRIAFEYVDKFLNQ